MTSSDRKFVRMLRCLGLVTAVWMVGAAVAPSALAQGVICNSKLVVNFPKGNNTNRVVGDKVRLSLTVTNGPSLEAGVNDNQVFTLIDFFPSCLKVAGGVCALDQGAAAGAPPPIAYAGNFKNVNCPVAPTVNAADPFNIKFNLVPPYDFNNTVGCTFSFDVLVTETGGNGTANIQQLASTSGVCGSGLTSSDTGTAAITLTCPPCDDGNACNGVETCNPATAQCVPGTPLTCNDDNACTNDVCVHPTGCSNTPVPPDFCDDDNTCTNDVCVPPTGCSNTVPLDFCDDDNACTNDVCVPATGCSSTPVPPDFCDDSNACTNDICVPPTGCSNTLVPPDVCDDDNLCTNDACVPATGCENTPVSPDFCDDDDSCTGDICDPQEGCQHPPAEPVPLECREICVVIIDEDGIDNDMRSIEAAAASHDVTPDFLVNDDRPTEVGNPPLRWNELFPGDIKLLPTGQVDDEGWFALPEATPWPIADFVAGTIPQNQLDKIPDVMPLRNRDLVRLVGKTCVAVVYDSDISINYSPLNANLQGARYGLFSFTVLAVEVPGSLQESNSSTTLYDLWLRVEPPLIGDVPLQVTIRDHEPDSIQITKARYNQGTHTLIVKGRGNFGPGAHMTLSIDGVDAGSNPSVPPFLLEFPMIWNPSLGVYESLIFMMTPEDLRGRRVLISTDEGGSFRDNIK